MNSKPTHYPNYNYAQTDRTGAEKTESASQHITEQLDLLRRNRDQLPKNDQSLAARRLDSKIEAALDTIADLEDGNE